MIHNLNHMRCLKEACMHSCHSVLGQKLPWYLMFAINPSVSAPIIRALGYECNQLRVAKRVRPGLRLSLHEEQSPL
jgi:hypothetical protein